MENGQVIIIFLERQKGNQIVSHSVRLKSKEETSSGSLDIANLDLDFVYILLIDLDPSLEMFRSQKCLHLQFSTCNCEKLCISFERKHNKEMNEKKTTNKHVRYSRHFK